jgi:serine/threonine-protein phosphatase 5
MGIAKPKLALKDFRTMVKVQPGNKDALEKLKECEKIVKRINFEKAIEGGPPPSAFEGFDSSALGSSVRCALTVAIEQSYDGYRLTNGMTREFIDDMITRFKINKRIHKDYVHHALGFLMKVYKILFDIKELLMKEPTMLEISIPNGHTLTICGDTHGQFYDVLEIFRRNGYPSSTHHYLFNGDFVDRGSWSTEVALTLYAFKLLYPQNVHINRGNHETDDMNKVYGFEGECRSKYNDRVFKMFSETFSALPLASLVGGKYLVLHGGLFSKDGVTLDDIRAIDRHARRQPASEGLVNEMLWTDPQPNPGRGPSKRGVGLQFGPDITKAFCETNDLEAVIRSHEVRMGGYEVEHDNRLITVFSAPNYWYFVSWHCVNVVIRLGILVLGSIWKVTIDYILRRLKRFLIPT